MASNITVTIGADATQLRAGLAIAQAELRGATRELNSLARTAARTGEEIDVAKVGQAAAAYEKTAAVVAGLKTKMEAAASSGQVLATGYYSAAGAAQQLSFQFNDLFTQIAAGTSPMQALAQQGGQIVQIFQMNSGAADLLRGALGALISPIGLATTAAVTLAGAYYGLSRAAAQAAEEIRKVQDASLAAGRDPAFAAERVRGMASALQGQGMQNAGSATSAAAGIERIANLSDNAKTQLNGILLAFAKINTESDLAKAIEQLDKMFSSVKTMQDTVEKNRLLTGTDLQTMLSTKDAGTAADLLTRGLVKRYTPTTERMQAERLLYPFQALGVRPPRALVPSPEGETRLTFPTDEEIEANKLVAEGNKLPDKRAEKVEAIAKIRRALGNNELQDVERARNAIKALEREIEDLDRRINKPTAKSVMSQLESELAQRRAGIFEGAARGGGGFSADLQRMIAAADAAGMDIGITSGTRTRERQQQLWDAALAKYGSAAAARKWVAPPGTSMHERGLAADLSFGPGARDWAHANAGRFGLNFPLGNEPWHAESAGARGGGGAAEAARTAALRDTVQFWEGVRSAGRVTGDDLVSVERKIADARRQLAEATLRDNERSAREAAQAAARTAQERAREIAEAERQITSLMKQEAAERLAAQKRAAAEQRAVLKAWIQPIRSAFIQIETSISSSVGGLLTGAKTWSQALKSVTDSIILGFSDSLLSSLSKSLAKSLGATAGEGLFDYLGSSLGKSLFGGTVGAAAAGGAGAATGGGLFSGIFGWLGGLLAFSRGGVVPSAAGGWALPSFSGATPALLHSREMVLPAPISEGLQSAIAGGGLGGGVTVNLHAVAADGPAVERLFKNNGRLITNAVRAGFRSNAITPASL